MAGNNYTVAIVGFGGMGNWHRELLMDFERIQCIGSFDVDPKKQEKARSVGLHAYESLDVLLNDPAVDIVLIATPNDLHKGIAIEAMKAHKTVVCEKPVTPCSEDLQEMLDCATQYQTHFTVHQNRRWDEDFLTVKKIYNEGVLGEVFNIESRVHGSRGIPGDWRGKRQHGGGMVLDWGVHIIDQMLQIIPEKVLDVYAKLVHVTNYEVEDGFKIFLTFESGKTGLLEVGTSNFIPLPRWYMQGVNGTAMIEDFTVKGKIVNIQNWGNRDVIPIKTAAGLTKTMAPRTDDSIKECELPFVKSDIHDFYKNVVAVIEGKEQPCIRHEELMRCMKLMEAAFESDRKKQVVRFE